MILSSHQLQSVTLLVTCAFSYQRLWPFCMCMKYFGNRWMDLRQIHMEHVFWSLAQTSLKAEVKNQRSRSPATKTAFFGPFGSLHAVYVWSNIFSLWLEWLQLNLLNDQYSNGLNLPIFGPTFCLKPINSILYENSFLVGECCVREWKMDDVPWEIPEVRRL